MKIALTFDVERDIPNLLDTTFGVKVGLIKIIKVLDKYDINGTFFCTGNVAERLPEYIQLLEQKGHEIACHGLNHERFYRLNFKKCYHLIYQNKKILEEICQNSKILGFRAPYLRTPKFLFEVLDNLNFRYDSSIRSPRMLPVDHSNSHVQEFHPSSFNALLRLPLSYSMFRSRIFRKKLIILCLHPWEAIDMKNVVLSNIHDIDLFNRIVFRPDRFVNTGENFIARLCKFIEDSLLVKAEFIMLKQLLNNS
ncbi:MAG: polysaccharide deacetylase family protein [Promethearchaeota archaeon]